MCPGSFQSVSRYHIAPASMRISRTDACFNVRCEGVLAHVPQRDSDAPGQQQPIHRDGVESRRLTKVQLVWVMARQEHQEIGEGVLLHGSARVQRLAPK